MTKQKLPREESNRNGWRAIAAELLQKGVWREDAACSLCHKGHVQMSTARPCAGPRPVHKGPWEPSHAPLTVGVSMHMWQEAGLGLMGSRSRCPVWNSLGTMDGGSRQRRRATRPPRCPPSYHPSVWSLEAAAWALSLVNSIWRTHISLTAEGLGATQKWPWLKAAGATA